MFGNVLTKIFGSKHERDIKRLKPKVDEINRHYDDFETLSDDELKGKTDEFKKKISEATRGVRDELEKLKERLRADIYSENGRDGEHGDEEEGADVDSLRNQIKALEEEEQEIIEDVLNEILPEAFAVVKQTCKRLVGKKWRVCDQEAQWDMIPYDVQLVGAIVLHEGKIAEMATGEGKTLVATMPLYLNALPGKGVHLVTVNDYLARRDCEWMGEIYKFLGLTVEYIQNDMNSEQRKQAYAADITYGTNNEFGFDYLRDNMVIRLEEQVQRRHNYAIVDEVDSVLIDEARTPLIISGPVAQSTHKYDEMKPRVEQLVKKQTRLVNEIVAEGERLLEEGDEYDAGIKLLQASRGAPKNKRLAKLLQEVGVKKLIRRVENDYMRDKKLHEIDEELFYAIDEKAHTIDLTEAGRDALSPNDPEMFVLPDLSEKMHEIEEDVSFSNEDKLAKKTKLQEEYTEKSEQVHNISQLLRAYSLFEKDVEYVVSDGKVMIVDEFTGRLMPGRRYSDGLHQALEAKEGVKIERETQTLATVTLQNYFRLYNKLAGMTGTAETEAGEFWEIYKLDVVVIPTNEPVRRIDYDDQIYRTKREKYKALIDEIEEMHIQKRPVLVGTISVEVSETLSRMLKRKGIRHSVLNAKHHQREADIVSRAGEPGAVTIATNMAGRGTDIKLGTGVVKHPNCALVKPQENEEVCPYLNELNCYDMVPCGLHIMGTERHEARRIDRQLRGRSGRQGDPGSSRFYLSLEDDLMRLFQSDRVANVMDRLGVQEGEVIQHRMVTRSIERAQKRVESHNFDIRKHLLEYDDVMNQQREVIYNRRDHALQGENLKEEILEMMGDYIENKIRQYTNEDSFSEEWDWDGLRVEFRKSMLLELPFDESELNGQTQEELFEKTFEAARKHYDQREQEFGEKVMRQIERLAMLRVIDERWREHLYEMDQLKEGIGLRAYGQKNPLLEYKSEGFRMFTEMLDMINEQVIDLIFKAQVQPEPVMRRRGMPQQMTTRHDSAVGMGFEGTPQQEQAMQQSQAGARRGKRQPVVVGEKVGRNDPCPCGSGKKYKRCHGAV
ncbi:preprotein translocase subunit SecA [candidate division KSB1 bacterium]|nr:preprotein translocase subunit SecA [candidate division KSB1 bacterium]NIR72422.1 preprotein translocase subunit SecA [candidate division KSB1 bacterium]NIS23587.1 preprotein translocase subunit SecA [candidate division KSB1 bacterium]NIT70513.1 preprotein translocase subunit SecA [candidate division KSB1 bacterium]NIU24221.1 preprotein translocase subunit SecA [candidate division KSB1 bacterium]